MAAESELTIAPAPARTYEAILGLHHQAGWNPSRVDGEVWGARFSDELVGSMQFEEVRCPDVLFVRAIVVREDVRGRGIEGTMLTRIVATRVAEWWLECRTERIGFYERHGFALVAPEDLRRRITYFLFAEARKKGRKKEGASTRNSPTKTRPFFAFRKG